MNGTTNKRKGNCLITAPSKAGGAQRSPRRQCERILSQSKCTISLGDFFSLNFCWLVIPNLIGLSSHFHLFLLSVSSFPCFFSSCGFMLTFMNYWLNCQGRGPLSHTNIVIDFNNVLAPMQNKNLLFKISFSYTIAWLSGDLLRKIGPFPLTVSSVPCWMYQPDCKLWVDLSGTVLIEFQSSKKMTSI